jgi:hypothetical protein
MKNSNNTIGNRTRDLLVCSASTTAPPRVPSSSSSIIYYSQIICMYYLAHFRMTASTRSPVHPLAKCCNVHIELTPSSPQILLLAPYTLRSRQSQTPRLRFIPLNLGTQKTSFKRYNPVPHDSLLITSLSRTVNPSNFPVIYKFDMKSSTRSTITFNISLDG